MKFYSVPILYSLLIFTFLISCKTDTQTDTTVAANTENITVTIRTRAEADRLNPFLSFKAYASEVSQHIFPTMLAVDPFTLDLVPVLVKSRPAMATIEEGDRKGWTTFTYELLDEAVWEDGSPVTAEDYIFTLKLIFNPHAGTAVYRSILGLIKDVSVDAGNPKKFTVYTDESFMKAEYATGQIIFPRYKYDPDNLLGDYQLNYLTDAANAEAIKADEKLKEQGELFVSPKYSRDKDWVSGCGPYKVEEWIDKDRIVLVKKENWWGDQLSDQRPILKANPKRLIFRPIADAAAAMNLLKSGELDVVGKIPQDQFEEFKNSEMGKAGYNFYTPDLLAYFYYGMNTPLPKLSDKRVRRAIAHLVDVKTMIGKVMPGMAIPTIGPFHPIRSYYHNDLQPIELNIEKAKTLLAAAGWKDSNNNGTVDKQIDGQLVEMELDLAITTNNIASTNMGLIFQQEAKKAGVKINLDEKEAGAFATDMRSGDFELFARGAGSDPFGDDPFQYWHSKGGSNVFGFGNAESDALIEAIRVESDLAKRTPLYLKLQELMYEEQPVVFMYTTKERIIVDNRFKNVKPSIVSPGYLVGQWTE